MDKRDRTTLLNNAELALDYIDRIRGFMIRFGGDEEDFLDDIAYQDACITEVNNITQCLNRIRDHNPLAYNHYFINNPHGKGVAGLRGKAVHDYENFKPSILWNFMVGGMNDLETILLEIRHDCLDGPLLDIKKKRRSLFDRR